MKKHVRMALVALASATILPAFAADQPIPVLRLQEVTLAHLLDPAQGKDGARQVDTAARPVTLQTDDLVKHEADAREDGSFKVVPFKAR